MAIDTIEKRLSMMNFGIRIQHGVHTPQRGDAFRGTYLHPRAECGFTEWLVSKPLKKRILAFLVLFSAIFCVGTGQKLFYVIC